ncbi:hypothetical protein SMD11_4268 [Streptomyces albireticuli]|uniref:Uncharacterized protein n=1 Tax=Streptomyces albireticuli TaxID=1940 RepID=A0A1Z2L6E6_9ACTN|nr:hypothetical protein [Streptomyces albireticuli]ARZ69876.1 hypothetical protein SMD11_4268 [Streptomyces albireticuli]
MRKNAHRAWRATGIVTALATAAAIASVAPVQAQATAPVPARVTAELSAWITDGWGGGTVTSQPAGINCHTTAWDPYGSEEPPWNPAGICTASFEIGTTVTFTATPDPGSYVNFHPTPNPVTVRAGYNFTWAMFCPEDGLCSAG